MKTNLQLTTPKKIGIRQVTKMKFHKISKAAIFILFLGISVSSVANNIQVGTPTLPTTTSIQFTLQWDNSWKVASTSSYDAVWVFVKYQDCSTFLWTHVGVTGNTITGGVLQIDNAGDGLNKGVFIRRTADGTGNIASATVTLNMTTVTDNGYNYQVFAMEMVYIPTASFWLGNNCYGGVGCLGFYQQGASFPNYNIISNGAVFSINYNGISAANPPAAYPEGYDAFYCMKYEISQEQYVSFLNTLTYDQQVNRTAVSPTVPAGTLAMTTTTQNRNGIKVMTSGIFNSTPAVYACDFTTGGGYNQTDDGQNIACNWLMWDDLIAYLDWAALRPMSEFEWEKVCRGTATVSTDEYVWSSVAINPANSGALTGGTSGFATETSTSTADGLCAYNINNGTNGPLRVGFAATAATGRTGAGATFYGVLDMGGNVWEQVVDYQSTTFTTAAGDGTLSPTGYCNTAFTPTYSGGVLKGGNWYNTSTANIRITDRNANDASQIRDSRSGGRGVRMP